MGVHLGPRPQLRRLRDRRAVRPHVGGGDRRLAVRAHRGAVVGQRRGGADPTAKPRRRGIATAGVGPATGKEFQMESVSRRKLLATAGAATGAAAVAAAPSVAQAALDRGEVTDPSGPAPAEVVVAVVRDEKRGEVTVMAGEREVTYRDRSLVKRLMKAAPKSKE